MDDRRDDHAESEQAGFARREFLKGAVVGGAAAAAGLPQGAEAQTPAPAAAPTATATAAALPVAPGYEFLNIEEAAFVEKLVDHMVPADEFTPKGTDMGLAVYIDRALVGSWGKGDRLYMQGPWKEGVPSQGYQLPLTPAQLYRAGITATNAHCQKTYGKPFDRLSAAQREEVLQGLAGAKIKFDAGPPVRPFWTTVYQTVMEGMFADPMYGGNRDKAGWKLIGFPGVLALYHDQVEKYRDKELPNEILSIQDLS